MTPVAPGEFSKPSNVSILVAGRLSPQQILIGAANDPDIGGIEAVIVIEMLKDDVLNINWSCMPLPVMCLLARHLQLMVDEEIQTTRVPF